MYLVQIHFQKIKLIYFYPFKSWIFCSNTSFALTLTLSVTLSSSLWTIQSLQPPPSSGLLEMFFKMHFSWNLLLVRCLLKLVMRGWWWSKVNLWEPILSFHQGHFGLWTQVVKCGYKFFYLLSHLTSSGTHFEEGLQNSMIYVYIYTLTLCQSLLPTINSSKQNEVFVFINFTDKKISSSNLPYRITAVMSCEYKEMDVIVGQ